MEFKPFLSFNYAKGCEVKTKEFDVMRAINSFLNSTGGILLIGVADDKTIIGLEGDYSILPGERKNFDAFENRLRNLMRTKYFRSSFVGELITVRHSLLSHNDVCLIEIRKSEIPLFVYAEDNKQYFFVRQGNNTSKLEGIELSHYIKRHFLTSVERIDFNYPA